MIWRRPWTWLLVAVLHGTPTQAQVGDPCGQLFLPEGYQLICRVHTDARGWQLVVQPEEGAFASLSKLTLRPVNEGVTDPKAWLRDQLTIDLSGFESTLDDLLHGDDSPLAGTSLEDLLASDALTEYSDLPNYEPQRDRNIEEAYNLLR